ERQTEDLVVPGSNPGGGIPGNFPDIFLYITPIAATDLSSRPLISANTLSAITTERIRCGLNSVERPVFWICSPQSMQAAMLWVSSWA
ncbi:MAG TPA: hypothetical protein PLN84_03255, partial [Methanoculleus sp.]|uniref:hypothetical protein n=1 Tax=Methanoculleus sp. TaxID=90427 RepID=UPI002CC6CE2D|nr:hypothetical protein [Methanoculleus sp.]